MVNVHVETGDARREMARAIVDQFSDAFIERLKAAERIFLKPNLIDHKSQLATTHVDTVRGVLDSIRVHTNADVLIGDAGYTGTKASFAHLGYEQLAEEYPNVVLVDVNDDQATDGTIRSKDGSDVPVRRSLSATQSDVRISIAPMKIHREVGVSLSVTNWAMGTWIVPSRISTLGRVWAKWPWLQEGLWSHHASIAKLYQDVPCHASIVDGVLAMEGDGPTEGTALRMNVMLGGEDPVAVDAVASTLMGIDPGEIGYLSMLHEGGFGTIDMTRINIPPMLISELTRGFRRPRGFDDKLLMWRSGDPQITTTM